MKETINLYNLSVGSLYRLLIRLGQEKPLAEDLERLISKAAATFIKKVEVKYIYGTNRWHIYDLDWTDRMDDDGKYSLCCRKCYGEVYNKIPNRKLHVCGYTNNQLCVNCIKRLVDLVINLDDDEVPKEMLP